MNCRHPSNLFIVLLQPVFNKRIEAGRGRTPQSYTEAHSLGTVKPGHFAEPSLNEWSNAEAGTAGSLMRQCSYRSCWLMISSPKTLSCLQKTIFFFFWQGLLSSHTSSTVWLQRKVLVRLLLFIFTSGPRLWCSVRRAAALLLLLPCDTDRGQLMSFPTGDVAKRAHRFLTICHDGYK